MILPLALVETVAFDCGGGATIDGPSKAAIVDLTAGDAAMLPRRQPSQPPPRLAPHVPAIRRRIAEVLGIGAELVNVKATTAEGLGAIGRGEGIAAQAVATLRERA